LAEKKAKGVKVRVNGAFIEVPPPEEVRREFIACQCNLTTLALHLGFVSYSHFRKFLDCHLEYSDATDVQANKMELKRFRSKLVWEGLVRAAKGGERWAIEKIAHDFLREEGFGSFEIELAQAKASAKAKAEEQDEKGAVRDLVALFKRPSPEPATEGAPGEKTAEEPAGD
jgi:hypothetical protein